MQGGHMKKKKIDLKLELAKTFYLLDKAERHLEAIEREVNNGKQQKPKDQD